MSTKFRSENLLDKATRRDFVKTMAAGTAALGAIGVPMATMAESSQKISAPASSTLLLGGYSYDRTKALAAGKVTIGDYTHSFMEAGIGDLNSHVIFGPQELDVTEVGLHPFMLAFSEDNFRDYSLLPIFPLRTFRHKSVFIRTDRNINAPADLKGKTIGTPGYSSTSLTWIRGFMQDEYGVSPSDIKWVTSAEDSTAETVGKVSKWEQFAPEGIEMRQGPPGMDESDLLVSGEVDALFHAVEPKAFVEGNPIVSRLFPDSRSAEQAYYSKTGIFPIMHVVAIKNSFWERDPGVVQQVFDAYSRSKAMSLQKMNKLGWAMSDLPWFSAELEDTIRLMGRNYWPYGIELNRKTLDTMFRYSHQQGMASRQLTIEELFHPSSLELVEVIE